MPELPEVETVRKQLESELVGEEVVAVEVRREKCYQGERGLAGKIEQVRRAGKYLFIGMGEKGLAVHLKMTGRLVIGEPWYETAKHTRVVMRLASGRTLYFWDTRTFGYVKHESDIKRAEKEVRQKLGPEPWEMNENTFIGKIQKSSRAIKNIILDQNVIAGVGNIYANDALWEARLKPQRGGSSLTRNEARRLLVAIKKVLERGLAAGGASDNSYVDAYGNKGSYQTEFLVYGRTGDKCDRCKLPLVYGKVGGRGTWWCEGCQR